MLVPQLEKEVQHLSARVSILEKKVSYGHYEGKPRFWFRLPDISLFSQLDMLHFSGWFLLTILSLGLITEWAVDQTISTLGVGGIVLAIWMIVRGSEWLGVSDSTKQLLQEGRASRKISAADLHRRPMSRSLHSTSPIALILMSMGAFFMGVLYLWFVLTYIPDEASQLLALLLLPTLALRQAILTKSTLLFYTGTLATFVLLMLGNVPSFSLTYLTLISLVLFAVKTRAKDWKAVVCLVVASLVVLATWALRFSDNTSVYLWVLSLSLIFTLFYNLPFIYLRRTAEEREMVRTVIFLSGGYLIALPLLLAHFLSVTGWEMVAALGAFIFAGLGWVSWLRFERFSYAKYYFFMCIGLVMVTVGSIAAPGVVTLSWFMLSIGLLTSGFILESYSLRMLGLGILLLTLGYFTSAVLPDRSLLSEPFLLQERVWIGSLLFLFLLVVAQWYKGAGDFNADRSHNGQIRQGLYLLAGLLLLMLVVVVLTPPLQTLFIIAVGLLLLGAGAHEDFPFLQAVGIAMAISGGAKLLLTDSALLSIDQQLLMVGVFAAVSLVSGYYLYSKKPTKYHL